MGTTGNKTEQVSSSGGSKTEQTTFSTRSKTEQIRLSAYKNEKPGSDAPLSVSDRLLWYEYRDLYQRFRAGTIDQKQAEAEKNDIMRRYEEEAASQEMTRRVFEAQANLWRRIEPYADEYRKHRTIENADAFIESVYNVKIKGGAER